MKKLKYNHGDVILQKDAVDDGIILITKEEYEKKSAYSIKSYNNFVAGDEWMKFIDWKPADVSVYAIPIESEDENDNNEGKNEGKCRIVQINEWKQCGLGNIKHTQENLDALFTHHPKLKPFKRNLFTQYIEYEGRIWDEDIEKSILKNFFRRTFNEWCPDNQIMDTLYEKCSKDSYHPVQEYISELAWDGVERLETFMIEHYGAADNKLNRTYFKRWMVAMVKRIFEPGCKFDSMLILTGEQGKKKTSLFEWLGTINKEKYYSEVPKDIKDINNIIYSSLGKIIMTFDDFDDMCGDKGEIGKVKSFITTRERTAALKWKHQKDYKVSYVFAGTTNETDILVDDGTFDERRFWIIEVNPKTDIFDLDESIKRQLYAEAYYIYNSDPDYRLWIWEPELKAEEIEMQKQYKKAASDPVSELIYDIFNTKYSGIDPVTGCFHTEAAFINAIKENNLMLKTLYVRDFLNGTTDFMNTNIKETDRITNDIIEEEKNRRPLTTIPYAWISNLLYGKMNKRGINRIVQILHIQGFTASKVKQFPFYGKYITVIKCHKN